MLHSGINIPALPTGLTVQVYKTGTGDYASITDKAGTVIAQPFSIQNGRYEFDAGAEVVDIKLGGGASAPDTSWNSGAALWIYATAMGGGTTVLEGIVQTEADFNALAASNRDKFAGSGFVEFGKHVSNPVNEGMYSDPTIADTIYLGGGSAGTSKSSNAVCTTNGANHEVGVNAVLLPPAPATAALTERQDLIFLESWHELISDKDIVYPLGNVQSLIDIDTATGLITVNGAFTGFGTYSLFGEWQASSALIGKGLVWSTMSDANRKKFVSDHSNNVYLNENGELAQVRYRVRVVEGLETGYDIEHTSVTAQGSSLVPGANNFVIDSVDKGLYRATESDAIPIALVSRRNQGAFHPVWNPNGTAVFSDTSALAWWYLSTLNPQSTEDCFTMAKYVGIGSGAIADGIYASSINQGRPGNKFYDAIYEGDVLDLRNAAHKQDLNRTLEREFNKLVAGEMRGWEGAPAVAVVGSGATVASSAGWLKIPTAGLIDFVGVTTVETAVSGRARRVSDGRCVNIKALKFVDPDIWFFADEDLVYGEEWFISTYTLNTSESKTILWCDIIGDPANYPAEWTANGVMGNALLVGEEGEDYSPKAILIDYKYSRKLLAFSLAIASADGGATWSDITAVLQSRLSVDNRAYFTQATGDTVMVFYETEASPFENATNAEVLELGDVLQLASNDTSLGCEMMSHLVNKVPVDTVTPVTNPVTQMKKSEAGLTGGSEVSHIANTLMGTLNPSAKVLPYLTRENGKMFLQALFKEMKYDVTWGDDSKFNVVDNVSTTTDDNANVVLIGQKRVELPYFIGDVD